jgi:putative tryptophan/tyrosine transport system substrate-binding protein
MRRRESLAALGALVLAGASAPCIAQSTSAGRARKIGFLLPGPDPGSKLPGPQRQGSLELRKLGWIEGENLGIERLFAEHQMERMPALASELLRRGVELIVAQGSQAALAAARATKTVPIVFGDVVWPLEQGLIDSYARPGRNATGMAYYAGVEVSNKRLEFLREIAPSARRLTWLWPAELAETVSGGSVDMAGVMGEAAKRVGFEPRFHDVRSLADLNRSLVEASAWRTQALMVSSSFATVAERQRVAEYSIQNRLPSASPTFTQVEAGALMYYGPARSDGPALFARFYSMVDRILRGAKPADLPVELPSRYDLVVNMRTAKAIGLAVPQSILLRADRVIE